MKKKTSDYSKLLRDPRWQKKRLEILNRDEFHCQVCFDGESTLNVHHCYYIYGQKPWEYDNESLVTLCEDCHKIETVEGKNSKEDLIQILSRKGFLSGQFQDLAKGFFLLKIRNVEVFISALAWALSNEEMCCLIEDKYFDNLKSKRLENEAKNEVV